MLLLKQILSLWKNAFEMAEGQYEKSSGQEVGAVGNVIETALGDLWV